jgi:aromatic ring-opening dioxygenase LigB subunit
VLKDPIQLSKFGYGKVDNVTYWVNRPLAQGVFSEWNPFIRYVMTQKNTLNEKHMKFFISKGKICFLAFDLKNFKIVQGFFKHVTIHSKTIHVYIDTIMNQVRKYFKDFPLESGEGIAQF